MPSDPHCHRLSVLAAGPQDCVFAFLRQAPDPCDISERGIMYLMYYTDVDGKRVYTLDVSCTHCIQCTWRRLPYA